MSTITIDQFNDDGTITRLPWLQLVLLRVNIAVDAGGIPVVHTLDPFQININYMVPVQAQALATGGDMAPSVAEIRQEMDTNSVALHNYFAK